MDTSRRQQYLSTMGIECWLPRQQLPGAAPGRIFQPQEADKQVPPQQPQADVIDSAASLMQRTAVSSPAAELRKAITNTTQAKTKPVPVATPKRAVAEPSATAFRLGFYAWAPTLLIVDQVHGHPLQQQLISNLLFALGHTEQRHNPPDFFDWPMPHDRQRLALSPHEMVYGALQRLLEQHDLRHILLLGELAAQHVLGIESSDFVPGMTLESPPLYPGVSLVGTHSSLAMLETPLLKAATWRHLQSLRV